MEAAHLILLNLTIVLVLAGLMGALFSRFKLPSILGFIVTGIFIGPGGLGWVNNTDNIYAMAQLGIIFLLFIQGAELSFPQLKAMRVHAFWAGVLQMLITHAVFTLLGMALGLQLRLALFLAGCISLSSTAIVLKVLANQAEQDSTHGRIMMGILLVQDLAIVALIAFMPLLLGQSTETSVYTLIVHIALKAVLFLAAVIGLGLRFIPGIVDKIAAHCNKDVFIVFVMAFALAVAFVTEELGLSYAVGAFVAGLSLSKSITSRQIIVDTLPFRDIFSTIFFVSVGMLLNVPFLLSHLPLILTVTLGIVFFKSITVGMAVLALRFPLKTALWCAGSLFQVGEFAFILMQSGMHAGSLEVFVLNTVTSAIVLTMLLTPIIMNSLPRWILYLETHHKWLHRHQHRLDSGNIPPENNTHVDVVIAGYGPVARNLVQVLQLHHISFCIVEMNVHTIQRLQQKNIPCIYGDAASLSNLASAGIEHAKVLALTIPDVRSAELALKHAKQLNPNIYCLVRSRYQHPLKLLFSLGADEVVYEEFETSMSFIHTILSLFNDKVTDHERTMLLLRENRRNLSQAHHNSEQAGTQFGRISVFQDTKIEWLELEKNSPLIHLSLAQSDIRAKTGVTVLALIDEHGAEHANPSADWLFKSGHVLVVLGTLEQLTRLEELVTPDSVTD